LENRRTENVRFWPIVGTLVVSEFDGHSQNVFLRVWVANNHELDILVAERLGPATALRLKLQQLCDLLGMYIRGCVFRGVCRYGLLTINYLGGPACQNEIAGCNVETLTKMRWSYAKLKERRARRSPESVTPFARRVGYSS